MATDSTTPTPEVPEGFTDPMTLDELVKHWAAMRLGHEAVMLDKLPKVNKYQFDAAEFARTGKWPEQTATAESADMGVNIGNREIHNHYHTASTTQTAQQANTTTQAPEAQPQVGSSTTNTLGKIAAGAALVGAGGLGTIGIGMALDHLTKPDPPAVVQPAEPGVDTDTNAGLRFKD